MHSAPVLRYCSMGTAMAWCAKPLHAQCIGFAITLVMVSLQGLASSARLTCCRFDNLPTSNRPTYSFLGGILYQIVFPVSFGGRSSPWAICSRPADRRSATRCSVGARVQSLLRTQSDLMPQIVTSFFCRNSLRVRQSIATFSLASSGHLSFSHNRKLK